MPDRCIVVVYLKKVHCSQAESTCEDCGDRWTFVNLLPRSGFIHTVHHGRRAQEEADRFVETIKRNSDGDAPWFLSDGWKGYEEVLEKHGSREEPVPYAGRGRPKKPMRLVDEPFLRVRHAFQWITYLRTSP